MGEGFLIPSLTLPSDFGFSSPPPSHGPGTRPSELLRPAFRFLAISSIKNFCSRSASYSYYLLPPPPARRFQIQSFLHAEENTHTRLILTYPLAFFGSPPPPALSWHIHFLTPPLFPLLTVCAASFHYFCFLGSLALVPSFGFHLPRMIQVFFSFFVFGFSFFGSLFLFYDNNL